MTMMRAMPLKNLWLTTSTLLGMQTPLDHHKSLSAQDADGYASEFHALQDAQLKGCVSGPSRDAVRVK